MIKNDTTPVIKVSIFVVIVISGIGISKTISMSNTIKMIARRKNRIENGMRALWFGSNPHSNGDIFSRLDELVRIDRIHANIYTIDGRNRAISVDIIIKFI